MKKLIVLLVLITVNSNVYAGEEKRAWDRTNNPTQMGYDYISRKFDYKIKFELLPLRGSITNKPWSGDYWPTYKGGISFRWNSSEPEVSRIAYKIEVPADMNDKKNLLKLSPSEKYDLYVGRTDFPLTNHERQRTNVLKTILGSDYYDKDFKIPTWEGLCHSWAPATILLESPKPIVVKNADGIEIPFGASDIKALLTFHLHHTRAQTQFLGGRCNVDLAELKKKLQRGEISSEEYDEVAEEGACEDTNAGAFHIVLTNQIALKDEGFIADVTRDLEVWNHPIHSYSSRILKVVEGASAKAALGTVKEVTVLTRMHYTTEIQNSYFETSEFNSTLTKGYQYTLEINKDGEIIGGEWISADRPDFLWKQKLPEWKGFFAPLEKIYKASVAQ